MNEKETAEIRRRWRPDRIAAPCIYGCCVNEKKEIMSEFSVSPGLMGSDETEAVLRIMRKVLSGTPDKNLLELDFSTQEVMSGEKHARLMKIRNYGRENEPEIKEFFAAAAESLEIESSYLVLFAQDSYDVPAENGSEESENVFSYCLAAFCPIKDAKQALSFYPPEGSFKSIAPGIVVGSPAAGFMFPAFDDRSANIYNALYYSKTTDILNCAFISDVLGAGVPMPPESQKAVFNGILKETLGTDCSAKVAVEVRDTLCEQIADYKANGEEEKPFVSKKSVSRILTDCGINEEKVRHFETRYDEEFGAGTDIAPVNLIDTKAISVNTPEVSIKINSDRSDLLQTRVIDGHRYILIRAETEVEVNGVNINIE